MRSVPFTVAAAVGALLLLSACSDSGGGGTSSGGSSGGSSSSGDDAGKDAAKESPLHAYMKSIQYDGGDSAKNHKEVENIIASCMKEAGFEYTPKDLPSQPASLDDWEEMDPVERAEKYGYGWAGSPESEIDPEEFVSPDADYLAAMSDSEAAAYSVALFGDQQDVDTSELDWTKGGCYAKANHEVHSNRNAAYEDPAYEDLQEEIRRMFEKVPDDPRLAEINAEWSACMNEGGFDFARVNEAYESIAEGYATLPETADETAWADLRDKEVATAIADAKCQEKVGYPEKLQEVQFALEQEFIDTHKAELDAWIEQYATDEAAK
ncbi:hypothetical protein [Cellulomonas chengniuliangii]|uniref:hypothetical protein n=1 Tax=Cellulomonas chengniuliangii TaxID=2968084 RepID=UPI001D0F43DB|nr:hypothetical protein [Cellulomonas chengniuliangii]MCC2319043.1 hypothetical protein [Cellulomonas chengniuliangii]